MKIVDEGAKFVFHQDEIDYRFNDSHPFNQQRLVLTCDLLRKAGALPDEAVISPRSATEEELGYVHSKEYIQAVQALSLPAPDREWLARAESYGLTSEDTPYFTRMHEITARVVGGSLKAAELVMSGETSHALHLGGGLHHAFSGKGAGFCVYNDASVAIASIRAKYGARVLYIDTDVHHGDGVQWTFYTDPDVCTFSIHETGKYLFPGSGGVDERGDGLGYGCNFNLPMEPYTEDASWLECFEESLRRVVAAFKPDVIVSQHGCDAHAYDPLSHIHCSMNIYARMPQIIHRLAHEHCEGRWIALGGGGYDIWRVVPRAWSLLWLEMSGHPLGASVEADGLLPLPQDWLDEWGPQSPKQLPGTWLDNPASWESMPRRDEITEKNRRTLQLTTLHLPPETVG
ncbi:histone deacetylase [Paenibacillus swuensis]|uniref:Acetoin utilization protein AcuC n=1 Tax=Paenibacillus swuensis TaxID=1178515 RepID=A0A172TKE0_9BACL|nr:acetoin utilization protein AcuC [Paenibacillus swuensis]ANE47442.1 histone deacetylase [Paenibacillus swuensis]